MNRCTRHRTLSRFSFLSVCALTFSLTLAAVLLTLSVFAQGPGQPTNVNVNAKLATVGTPLNCADATTRCVPTEYATIQLAVNAAVAGDVVWVSAGTYIQTVAAVNSGTLGNTITLLANGTVTLCGMTFNGKSYIRVVGLTVDPSTGGCAANIGISGTGANTGLEFWNVTVQNVPNNNKGYSFDRGAGANQCNACIFMGGAIAGIGTTSGGDAWHVSGNDLFIGYMALSDICYVGIGPSGSRMRIQNNKFSGMRQCAGFHPDFYYIATDVSGYSNSVVESTWGIGTTNAGDNKYFHAENQSTVDWIDDVWRFNVAYNLGAAELSSMYSDTGGHTLLRWRLYNNTLAYGERDSTNVATAACGNASNNGGGALSYWVYNVIFYQCWGDSATTGIEVWNNGTLPTRDYNWAYSPLGSDTFAASWTGQTHKSSNVDPKLTDPVGSRDFTLQSTSTARGFGGPLTAAVGSGSGSTSLTVTANTGSFFIGDNSTNLPQYGGAFAPGDFITVGTTPVQVASVSGDVLTLATAISWTSGDAVYFGSSTTIDLGAFPYKAGGYTLSGTYHQSGSTVTVTPNDVSLARFAVVFENGMPKCMATAANSWACTVGGGVVAVTLYPRYASSTQSVQASGT